GASDPRAGRSPLLGNSRMPRGFGETVETGSTETDDAFSVEPDLGVGDGCHTTRRPRLLFSTCRSVRSFAHSRLAQSQNASPIQCQLATSTDQPANLVTPGSSMSRQECLGCSISCLALA